MRTGLRLLVVYLFFALVSGALHLGAIRGFRKDAPRETAAVTPPPTIAVQMVDEPTPAPPPRYRETREEREEDPVPEESLPEPEPEPELEPEPEPEPERKPEIESLREYREYLAREMPPPGAMDDYIPKIHFGENSARENVEIMAYFGMEVIAYPPGQNYYVYIEPRENIFRRNTDIDYLENYSNRVIFRTSPWFRSLKEKAAGEVGVSPGGLVIAQLLKPATANYIAWKQGAAAKAAGVSLGEVDGCDAQFVRAGIGVWIVRIDSLRLRDGRVLRVDDPEWAKISGGGR
jgi:hypothetical protein